MCDRYNHKPLRFLYSIEPYIGNLPKQLIGISTVGLSLIGDLYSLLVTSVWGK